MCARFFVDMFINDKDELINDIMEDEIIAFKQINIAIKRECSYEQMLKNNKKKGRKDKIASLGVLQFNMALNQDILILTYKSKENIPDPDNGTTNFAIDIVNQGKADYQGTAINNLAEQRVYLCYGDDQFPSVDLRTNAQGEFEFKDLQVGTYKVYVVGQLPPNANEHQEVSAVATISEKKSITDIGTLQIWY